MDVSHHLMHKPQFPQHRCRQRKRIGVVLSQTAVEAVEHERSGHALAEQLGEGWLRGLGVGGGTVGILAPGGDRFAWALQAELHLEVGGGFQQVHQVQVVGPGLGPVFPWVHGGVAADVVRGPVGGWAGGVVALQGLAVVGAFVAEQLAKLLQGGGIVREEQVPVKVAHFVPQVAEQGAVGLVQVGAPAGALGVVGFGDVEGDEAVGVAGHHGLFTGHVFTEFIDRGR